MSAKVANQCLLQDSFQEKRIRVHANNIRVPKQARSIPRKRPLLSLPRRRELRCRIAKLRHNGPALHGLIAGARVRTYIHCEDDPPLLFDRSSDPHETHNLAGHADFAQMDTAMAASINNNWNLTELRNQVLESQRRRHLIDRAHAMGRSPVRDSDVPGSANTAYFRPCVANPSASNYNAEFDIRVYADGTRANKAQTPWMSSN